MVIVAVAPGAGKSSVFPLRTFGDHTFNADDRAAILNDGPYRNIPLSVRKQVNLEFEQFITDSISRGRTFALETTLRSQMTFTQATLAASLGFRVSMIYVGLERFEDHFARVQQRSHLGGQFGQRVNPSSDLRKQHREPAHRPQS